jgi:tetratricopeptide (TPR) repeat protein
MFIISILLLATFFYFLNIEKPALEKESENISSVSQIPSPSIAPSPSSSPLTASSISEEVIKKNNEIEDTYNQGYDSFFQKKYSEAIELEDSVLKKDNTYYKAYNLKGIALCFSGNFKSGMENIDKSLELNPDYDYARFNKALAYELYRHYDDALTWYDKCLEVSSDTDRITWSNYGKASIYGRLGDVTNTVKFLKLSISYNLAVKEHAKTEEDFANVKKSKEFQDLIFK